MSRIIEAAVQLLDGRVVRGMNHRECWSTILGSYPIRPRFYREGFWTSNDRFVTRRTAATLARAAGQVPHGIANPKRGLSSNDLY